MCGIAGFLEAPNKRLAAEYPELVCSMTEQIRHRGPDDSGIWCDPVSGIALGHRRLAILDLSPEGHQPMQSACGRYVMVYNGEVYNFQALRTELEKAGHRFRGSSDTEIILAAFAQWGITTAITRFNGMFALAVWDRQLQVLDLVRDRIGQKPLYYAWSEDGALLFASELKAFPRYPAFTPQIDRNALPLLLRSGCIAAPYTIFQNVYKLRPGCSLRFRQNDRGSIISDGVEQGYWSATDAFLAHQLDPFPGGTCKAVDELEHLLRDAVQLCMVADVSLGAFLSGGIDSSLIVALMQIQSTLPVRTFSIAFHEQRYNEAHHAAAVAKHLGTEHTELYVTERDALDVIPLLPRIYDEPFADSSQLPTYLLAKLTRQHVTVALSGDGGDELFGGYAKYRYLARLHNIARLPGPLLSFTASVIRQFTGYKYQGLSAFLEAARTPAAMYLHLTSRWKQPAALVYDATEPLTQLTQPPLWLQPIPVVRQSMAVDMLTYLPDDILVKVDRAAMSVSLETRIPFLDHRVVEFAARVPVDMHYQRGKGKSLLRQVLARYVPPAMVDRPKMGFRMPIGSWLRGELRPWAEELLAPSRLQQQCFFVTAPIQQKWQAHLAGERDYSSYLWPVLMFQAWYAHWSTQSSNKLGSTGFQEDAHCVAPQSNAV